MKSLLGLWQVLAEELASWCDTSAHRDIDTLRRRVEHEGESFLTITLPSFAQGFEKSLEQGKVTSDHFAGFQFSGGLPKFLSGFLRRVFDATSGVLLDSADSEAVYAIRQLTLVFKKIELECTAARKTAAVQAYVETDQAVEASTPFYTDSLTAFTRISNLLFAPVFMRVQQEVEQFELVPVHGPGATVDRKVGNAKFVQTTWTDRLEEFFPWVEYVLPSQKWALEVDHVNFLSPVDEPPVKVTLVPKTLTTPRVIAIEPVAQQYMQQGLMRSLVSKLERFPGSDYIGFTDQDLNKAMAHRGSTDGSLATLDLSEASDRVSVTHAKALLRDFPDLSGAVFACRSTRAKLPETGEVITLSKFASMGSALCFPVEAMVFLTVAFLGIEQGIGRQLTRRDIQSLRGRVRVYGDDIIVPVEHVESVIRNLEAFGLKVNQHKSFWNGKFRESCGGDYFNGEDVTPIRLRVELPVTRRDARGCISLSAFGNALHKRGLWRSARYVLEHMEWVLGKDSRSRSLYPCVPEDSNAVGAFSFLGCKPNGWSKDLQAPLIRAFVPDTKEFEFELEGVWALRKALAYDWSDPAYREHLLRSGRGPSVRMKKGWVRAG